MQTRQISAAVRRGADLLDEYEPYWAMKIDRSSLNMRSQTQCVLGHVHGEYAEGLSKLASAAINRELRSSRLSTIRTTVGSLTDSILNDVCVDIDGAYYGFTLADEMGHDESRNAEWEHLGNAWTRAILQRAPIKTTATKKKAVRRARS